MKEHEVRSGKSEVGSEDQGINFEELQCTTLRAYTPGYVYWMIFLQVFLIIVVVFMDWQLCRQPSFPAQITNDIDEAQYDTRLTYQEICKLSQKIQKFEDALGQILGMLIIEIHNVPKCECDGKGCQCPVNSEKPKPAKVGSRKSECGSSGARQCKPRSHGEH